MLGKKLDEQIFQLRNIYINLIVSIKYISTILPYWQRFPLKLGVQSQTPFLHVPPLMQGSSVEQSKQ